jgi:hypothetical protein
MRIERWTSRAELQTLREGDYITYESYSGRIKKIEVHHFRNEQHFYIKLDNLKQTILIIT